LKRVVVQSWGHRVTGSGLKETGQIIKKVNQGFAQDHKPKKGPATNRKTRMSGTVGWKKVMGSYRRAGGKKEGAKKNEFRERK